ncbi:MAG: M23 family metallopeptidase [Proteobacteria bacterium]|nr:M23 family metallopeptidase [Pseudomonadota bacterium]
MAINSNQNNISSAIVGEALKALPNNINDTVEQSYRKDLIEQQKKIAELRQYNQQMVNSLMMDLAKLKAHIIRLDSLGDRLTDVAQLDKKAFNFSSEVAIGGSVDADEIIPEGIYSDFDKKIAQITKELNDQSKQFDILENLLLDAQLTQDITPTGKPADKGFISSYFGTRKDPFTGRKKMHKGIDMAGKSGSNVVATADGIVTLIEIQRGYGQVVDIDHGYGLSTRYGHNKSVLVEVGDIIKQGQTIATMGSTGRSTGPHVHYEVLKNGKHVNPGKYITTARKN